MTRQLDKAVPYFPDWHRILNRAAQVQTVPERHCEICDTSGAAMTQSKSFDGYVCDDVLGCGRRQNKTRRIR